VAASDQTPGRAYNIAGPDAVTTRCYYEMVAEAAGTPPPIVHFLPSDAFVAVFPDRASFALNRCYALNRIAADADFTPRVRLRDALAEVVAALDAAGPPAGKPPPPAQTTPLHLLLQAQSAAVRDALRDA
jgi:nucleoside-diphosphate-sugar epimerase